MIGRLPDEIDALAEEYRVQIDAERATVLGPSSLFLLRDVEEFKKAAVGEKRGEESGEKKEEGLHKETENSKTV